MADTRLTLSCGDYDRTRPLIDRTVATPGLDLTVIPLSSAERHTRFVRNLEFDVCELQIAQYLGLKSRGAPITAIPVPTRYGNTRGPIGSPKPSRCLVLSSSGTPWLVESRTARVLGTSTSTLQPRVASTSRWVKPSRGSAALRMTWRPSGAMPSSRSTSSTASLDSYPACSRTVARRRHRSDRRIG